MIAAGLGLAGVSPLAASGSVALGVCLGLGGAAAGSVNAASGRLILGWFGPAERGLAMGIRQMAQPLGVAVAAMALPGLSASSRNPALLFLAVGCLATAVLIAVVVRDPERPVGDAAAASLNPYRTPVLWRLHGAGALLVLPQFAVATFGLVFLIDAHGWQPATAGRVLAIAAFGGAAARIGAGWWSDRAGSRTGPWSARWRPPCWCRAADPTCPRWSRGRADGPSADRQLDAGPQQSVTIRIRSGTSRISVGLFRSAPAGAMVAESLNAGARAESGLRGWLSEQDGATDRSNLTG